MRSTIQRSAGIAAVGAFVFFAAAIYSIRYGAVVVAQVATPTPTQTPAAATSATPQFDQAAAIAKLKEQIKGREQEPAGTVFKNIQSMKQMPAARLLAVMEMGYARSLGVTCTHCHVPEKWESEENPNKQIGRDMSAMTQRINTELLKAIKNLSQAPTVNCTTCHRGQVKPALNLPLPKS
jgi:hypothetical protein